MTSFILYLIYAYLQSKSNIVYPYTNDMEKIFGTLFLFILPLALDQFLFAMAFLFNKYISNRLHGTSEINRKFMNKIHWIIRLAILLFFIFLLNTNVGISIYIKIIHYVYIQYSNILNEITNCFMSTLKI